MKTNTAKRILTLALLVLTAVFALSFVACDDNGEKPPVVIGGNTVTEIYIEKTKLPRQLYVQGQELDLTGGVLTTVVNDTPSPIPLNSEGVVITGYDKDTVGNQTVTVTYKEKTTTFPVTVIARAVAENYEANYFVGDSFNKTKGRLRLAKDNAETFVVNMSDPTVTVTAFDSSVAGEHSVTVSCARDGKTYDCSFNVTFHEPAEIKFFAPKKLSYTDTDAQLTLTGGYLTVKAAAPSNLTKSVPLTQAMVSGYDPSALTLENRYEPIEQVITVSYAGQTWTYTVSLSYSGPSVINELSKLFSDVKWDQKDVPELTEEQMIAAVDAMEVYLDLAPADQETIDETTLTAVVRAAAVAAQKLYADELNSLADAFMLDFSSGALLMLGKTYEAIEHAAERLSDEDDGFNRYAVVLRAIKKDYPTVKLSETVLINNYVIVHAEAANETIVPMLEHMMNVYDTMKDIPAEWTLDTLKEYEMDILDTVSIILLSEYKGFNYMALYNPITNWRSDFFEIIYTYYYEIKDGGKEDIRTKLWGVVPAPGLVYSWYTTFMSAYNEVYLMLQNTESGEAILYDTTKFFYYYNNTYKLADQLKSEGTPMDKGIYEILNGDYMMESYIRRQSAGYLAQMTGALNDSDITDIWEDYLAIYELYTKVNSQEAYTKFLADNKPQMLELFVKLTELTPTQLHSFLSTLNYLYGNTGGALPVLNYENGASSVLVACVVSSCMSGTPESTRAMLQNLFLAMEYYSLRNQNTTALDSFITAMEVVINAEGVSEEDKTAFFGAYGIRNLYDKYKKLYDAVKDQSTVEVKDTFASKLDELIDLLDRYDEILTVISTADTSTDEGKQRVNMASPLLFATYDRIEKLRNELLTLDGAEFVLMAKEYSLESDGKTIVYTIDNRIYSAKLITVRFMLANAMENNLIWDIHNTEGLAELLAQLAELMYAEFNGKAYAGDVIAMMNLFREAKPETRYAFFVIQGTQMLYGSYERYLKSTLSEELLSTDVLKSLLNMEIYYFVYEYNNEDMNALKTFRENYEAVKAIYEGLENKEEFDNSVVGETYNKYKEKYEAVKDIVIPETPEEEDSTEE